ncbi:MAG: hypothetical protein Q8J69_10740 [Sphingobacteriaceae bacterium]|nr:hypothetical protein [Sphingobacteriaceae bacterium]
MRLALLSILFLASTLAAFGQGDIEFITATTYNGGGNNVGSAVLPAPTGVEVGDVMVVQLTRNDNGIPTGVPAGWTFITSQNNGNNISQQFYYKFITTSEPADYTFSYGSNVRTIGHLLVYRNINAKSPLVNNASTSGSDNGNNNLVAPSVNALTTNTYLLAFLSARSQNNATDVYIDGSLSTRASGIITGANNNRIVNINGDEPIAGTGNTATKSGGYTPTGNTQPWVATSLLLRPSKIFYAYQSGLWSEPNSWTRDPSGTTLLKPEVPTPFDSVVILNGRVITLGANVTTASLGINIQAGATLNLQNFTLNTLTALSGAGVLRVTGATAYYPSVSGTNSFVQAGGGTVEYALNAATIALPTGPFNNLVLLRESSSAATYQLTNDLTVFGNLSIQRTGSANAVLLIGNSTVVRNLVVGGNVSVAAGCSITTVNANAIHNLEIGGDLVNNGVIRFTNQGSPNYTVATTTGAVNVTFTGNSSNKIDCFGTTDFYRLVLNKGVDQTFVLTVNSTNVANFGLYGPNNQSNTGVDPNPTILKALWIQNGTLRLRENISVPSLTSGGNDFFVPLNGALWVDGATVTSTNIVTGNTGFTIIGKLLVSAGELNSASSAGIVYRQDAQIIVTGGLVDIGQFRRSGASGNFRASYNQSGGLVIVRGGEDNNGFARFGLPDADCAFTMSGGELRISSPTTLNPGGAFGIQVSPLNYNVTGGTIRITSNTANLARINTSGPIFNLILERTGSGANFELNSDLTILNDISINTTASNLVTNNFALNIRRDFTIAAGTTFTPGTSTITFNGASRQAFTINGAISGTIHNLTVNKSADTLQLLGSLSTLEVNNSFSLLSGVLNDNGKTVEIRGPLNLSGIHIGTGKLQLTTAISRNISGSGSGVVQNLELSGPASNTTYTLQAPLRIKGALTFIASGGNQRILDIQSNNLLLDTNASVTGNNTTRFIRTNGLQSAGGVTKFYDGNTFTFPVGTTTSYAPATIAFDVNPATRGSITVRPVNFEHPNVTINNRSLTYYWRVTQNGFVLGSAKVIHNYTYPQANVVTGTGITEDGYVSARFDASNNGWVVGTSADVNETTNEITLASATFETSITGDYTAGDNAPDNPFGTVTIYYSYQSGPWNNLSTWSIAGHTGTQVQPVSIPNANSIVRIGNGTNVFHTVNVTANAALSGSLVIAFGSTLDLQQTTGHNFGAIDGESVAGSGRLRIDRSGATYIFPNGDFGDFIGNNGGEMEYYNSTTNAVNLPAAPVQYKNLTINAQNTGIITFPATNLVVLDTLKFSSASTRQVYSYNTAAVGGNITVNKDLKVQGGIFEIRNNGNARNITVLRNVEVAAGAIFRIEGGGTATTHALTVGGNITNNGTFDLWQSATLLINLLVNGTNEALLTGTNGSATTELGNLTVDKGLNCASGFRVNVLGTFTTQSNSWLTLSKGYFDFARTTGAITLTNTAVAFDIPANTCLILSGAGATINVGNVASNDADLNLRGLLRISNGTFNVGNAANNTNNDIEIASAGNPELEVSGGGVLNVNGQIRRSLVTQSGALIYKQAGASNVTIRGRNHNNTRGKIEVLNQGAYFEMGGTAQLNINTGGATTYADLYVRPDSSLVTGGTVRLTPLTAGGSETFTFDVTYSFYNLEIIRNGGSGTSTVNLFVNNLTVNNDFTLGAGGIINTNNLNVRIGGNFIKSATAAQYNGGTSTVTLFGNAAQISGDFTTQSFHQLTIDQNATVTQQASSPIRVLNTLEIRTGATLNDNGNAIQLRGNVINNGIHTSPSNSASNTLVFEGVNLQSITGTGVFGNLVLNNSNNLLLNNSITINRQLSMTFGLIDLGANRISFGENATITGSFSTTRMLRSNGVLSDAGVTKAWNGTGSFTFPLGVSGKYTPATINVTAATNPGTVNIRVVNVKHPSTRDAADLQLNYYWQVDTTGFAGGVTATHTYTYAQSDVTGTEANYRGGRFLFPNWSPLLGIVGAVNASTNVITLTGVNYLGGGFTAGESSEFTAVSTYYSRDAVCPGGCNWEDVNSWSTTGHAGGAAATPPNGAPVIIATGHTVNVTTNTQLAESVQLNGTAILNTNQTFAHNFGVVSGTGTIRIRATGSQQFVFPGGNYTAFTSSTGGTVEFYNAGNGILPTQTTYNRIVFKDASTRTQANVDWVINGDVIIEAGNVNNTSFNKNWELRANWNNQVGAAGFVPGTGTVTFNSASAQTITGVTNFFRMAVSGGGAKNLNNTITIQDQLILNSGRVYLGTHDLVMDSLAGVGGSPNASAMVVQNGTGRLRKNFRSTSGAFTFPIGEETGTAEYSPATLNFTAGTFSSNAQASVQVVDAQSSECSGNNNYITRFWTFAHNGITAFTVTATGQYTAADVVGQEAQIFARMSRPSLSCLNGAAANLTLKTITISGINVLNILSAGEAAAPEPTISATLLTFANVSSTSLTIKWTNGNGSGRLVLMRAGSAVNSNPADNVSYTADSVFAAGSEIGTSNWVVFQSSGDSVRVTGLLPATQYHIAVFEYSNFGIDIDFKISAPAIGNRATLALEPTTPAASLSFSSIGVSQFTLNWSNGNGAGRLVLARQAGPVNVVPADGMAYAANASFAQGAEVGSGNFVVFAGSGNTFTVTGLNQNERYHFSVFEYNGADSLRNYLATAPAVGNQHTWLRLQMKAHLEGPYNKENNQMIQNLTGIIPRQHPYKNSPFNFSSYDSIQVLPAGALIDWVLLEVRMASAAANATAATIKARTLAFIDNQGNLVDTAGGTAGVVFPTDSNGQFYITLYHRTHIPVMSALAATPPVDQVNGAFSYDFTTAVNRAFGTDALIEVENGVWALYAGRVENATPFTIDQADRNATWSDRNKLGYEASDAALEGTVDATDRSLTWNNRQRASQIPQ